MRTTSSIFLSQMKYATEILEQAQMLKCNPCRTPIDTEKKLGPEGSPVTDPTLYHSIAGSLHYFGPLHHNLLHTLRRSTSGYCVFLGDNLLTWSSKCHDTLSRSSAEAEYRGVANAIAETSWIRNLLRELHTLVFTATLVYCDNVSAVYMSANLVVIIITSLKCVLTQEHLDAICAKYFVPEEVHPQLPSPDSTMHERPAGKVGMYTRFFDYAKYRILFSTFFVSVLTHFRIPFSQLSVFGSAKLTPVKVRIVERARGENERLIVTVAKHRTVTLLPTSVVRSSGELSASVEREFVGDASVGDGGDQGVLIPFGGQKKRVIRGSERTPAASHPPKRLRADYGATGGSATGAHLWRWARDHTALLSAWSLLCECRSSARSDVPVMTEVTIVATIATTVAIPANVGKDKSAPHQFIFCSSSSSEKTDRTLSLFNGKVSKVFCCGSIRAEEVLVLVWRNLCSEWTLSRGMENEQLFNGILVSAARNLSLSSEVRMRAEYNILEKRKWKSLDEEKDCLLGARDKD
ncbi:ribonuclease H-like domain-containing protein [Tanacetum coccineum]